MYQESIFTTESKINHYKDISRLLKFMCVPIFALFNISFLLFDSTPESPIGPDMIAINVVLAALFIGIQIWVYTKLKSLKEQLEQGLMALNLGESDEY